MQFRVCKVVFFFSHECTFSLFFPILQLHSLATSVAKEAPLKEWLSSNLASCQVNKMPISRGKSQRARKRTVFQFKIFLDSFTLMVFKT